MSPAPVPPSAATPAPQRRIHVRLRHMNTLFLWGLALFVAFYFFDTIKLVGLGLLAAWCVTATLRPMQRWIHGPRWLTATLLGLAPVLVLALLVGVITWLLAEPIRQGIEQWPRFQSQLDDTLQRWSNHFSLPTTMSTQRLLTQVSEFLINGDGSSDLLTSSVNAVSNLTIWLAFVFFGAIFLLAERPGTLANPALNFLPRRRQMQLAGALRDLEPKLRWWMLGSLFNMVVTGLTSWLGYGVVLGFGPATPLAIIAAFGELVPNIGPVLAFGIALVFAVGEGAWGLAGVTIVYIVLQSLESYVLQPLVMRKSVSVPPVVTLFTVVLWGKLFGLPGLLLAIPINLLIWDLLWHTVGPGTADPLTASTLTPASALSSASPSESAPSSPASSFPPPPSPPPQSPPPRPKPPFHV